MGQAITQLLLFVGQVRRLLLHEYHLLKIKRPPFNTWLCLFAVEVTHDGYGPCLKRFIFIKETVRWKKKKYILSKESTLRSLEFYGIKSLNKLQPVVLYNIQSVNASGYAVIDSNIPLQENKKG